MHAVKTPCPNDLDGRGCSVSPNGRLLDGDQYPSATYEILHGAKPAEWTLTELPVENEIGTAVLTFQLV